MDKMKIMIAVQDIGLLLMAIPLSAAGRAGYTSCIVLVVLGWQIYAIYDIRAKMNKGTGIPSTGAEAEQVFGNIEKLMLKKRNTDTRAFMSQLLRNQAELFSLQQQINPHFLYNTLECIRGRALRSQEIEIAQMIELLARMFRYSADTASQLITLREEIAHAENYIAIQNYRFQNKFFLEVSFEQKQAEMENLAVPILLLQPIVENAIQHGLEPKIGPGRICLRIYASKANLYIRIKDDGIGMDGETLWQLRQSLECPTGRGVKKGKHMGIALANIHQRIRLLFGNLYGLSILSEPNMGTIVECVLPKIMTPNSWRSNR